jgi:diacylglycerol kinase (ATP)
VNTALLVNAGAGSASASGEAAKEFARALGWQVHEIAPGDGGNVARKLASSGVELVVAGGGDGTVSDVVHGLLQVRRGTLGVLPLGTGNDFARAIGMPLELEAAMSQLEQARVARRIERVDVLELEGEGGIAHAINSVNGGLGPLIRQHVDGETKARLGPLALVWGALASLSELEPWRVTYRVDGGASQSVTCIAFVIANSGSVGGGVQVAKTAKLDDGRFDLVTIRAEATLGELTIAAIQARFGDLFASDCVEHTLGNSLELVEAPADFAFTRDGERLDQRPRRVRVLPKALPVLFGAGAAQEP